MKKNLLITHTDLDGISPIILLNLTGIKFDYKSIEICDVTKTFEELKEIGFDTYEQIYITDLSLTEEIYQYINENNIKNIKVFDHHETHLFANANDYVNVTIEINGIPTCGTELFYLYLKDIYPNLNTSIIKEYVSLVRELDTYNFTSDLPKQVDSLKSVYGKNDFIKSITRRLKKDKEHFELTGFEKRFVKLKSEEITRYLQRKEKEMFTYNIDNYKCGVVFAETNKSELGNYLSLNNPALDLIIIFDPSKSMSYRTSRDDVEVNTFAAKYNGGGHRKASGSPISDEIKEQIIKLYYNSAEKLDLEKKDDVQ